MPILPALPPPPPPPPQAPPPPAGLQSQYEPPKTRCPDGGRSALLADIQKGMRLKKTTQVNDRSAPTLNKPREHNVDGNSGAGGSSGATATQGPALSGLFAGGFPVLRPVGDRDRGSHSHPVTRSGSSASLKQPLWNLPSQAESFRGSTPDLSPSRRPLERKSSLPKSRPVSSYTAPSSPSQPNPSFKPLSSPPTMTPPPPPALLHQELASYKPPPPPQITKPTWLPVQSHAIPMPLPTSPLVPPSSYSVFSQPPPKLADVQFGNYRNSLPPPPPPFPVSFTPSVPASVPPPPLPPPPKAPTGSTLRPPPPLLPPSYPCTAPSRKPPAVPGSTGVVRLALPPAPPTCSSTTELSSRIPPPLPPAPPISVRNGHLHSFDDFESKFQFHPVEDLPPPEAFRPFPRTYPSKEYRVSSYAPSMRTHLR